MQTALLAVQAARADGFPWSTWAGSLNLFVWLVVGAYLIWGCRPRYRLLGLAVLPLAVVLFVLARLGGGTGTAGQSHYSNVFLVLHVGLVLAAFAGFTLAAGVVALYLWQERRLKRRESTILRSAHRHCPARRRLGADDRRRAARADARHRCRYPAAADRGGSFDALMAVTLVDLDVYGAYLALRRFAGWRGRRAAYLVLAGFVLVAIVRLALPVTHFAT